MGMTVAIEVAGQNVPEKAFTDIFDYFTYIDATFSTYKETSEISRINRGKVSLEEFSEDMKTVFMLAEKTKQETSGYFDITLRGKIDPSGIVKGWAIYNAAEMLANMGFKNFYVDAGGDIETRGMNDAQEAWSVGIRNPFNPNEVIKILQLSDKGVATSGTYIRGDHIYNPKKEGPIEDIVSLTVIGPNVYEADRFATAAFEMGKEGIGFLEKLKGFEGYMINNTGIATMTTGFERYLKK